MEFKFYYLEFIKVGFGGSCHWCTEAIFQSLIGVTHVEQGWISSKEYSTLSEGVLVHFDPNIIPLEVLVEIHLHTHSCTSTHSMREKYRSAVYVYDNAQNDNAHHAIINLQKDFEDMIITKVLWFTEFKINKEQYLDYYYNNPEKAFCKNQIEPKLKKLISMFSKRVDNSSLKL